MPCRYSTLKGSGALDKLMRSPHIETTRPFLEQDIQTATESLRASTKAIEKNAAVLNRQLELLYKQARGENERRKLWGRNKALLRRRHERDMQNIAAAVRPTDLT